MKRLSPALVVMLAGIALMIGAGIAAATGPGTQNAPPSSQRLKSGAQRLTTNRAQSSMDVLPPPKGGGEWMTGRTLTAADARGGQAG